MKLENHFNKSIIFRSEKKQVMLKKHIAFFIFIQPFACNAQHVADSIKKHRASDEFVALYDDDIKVRVGFSNSFNSFRIKNGSANLDFRLTPNQQLRSTLTFMYKFIEIDLGYTPEFIRFNKDDEIRGKTKFLNFGTRFYFGSWMQSIQYAKTEGFYVDKDDLGTAENILFPDFSVRKIGGSTSYIFNPNFSFRAIFLQSEWQKKSAGSFVPSFSYYFTRIRDNNPSEDNSIDVSIGPSYYYNWVIKEHFLVSAGAYGGLGYNYTKTTYKDGTPSEKLDGISFQMQLRLTLGYNSKRFYTGAIASFDAFYYDADPRIHVQDQQHFFEFYIGYRFKGPDKVGKFLDDPLQAVKKKY